jgi:CubicO group peptidase (beta-lactamase class C family)
MLSFVISLPVQSQPKTADELKPDFSEVRKLIKAEMAARSIPSLSVAVVRRGEIIWEEAFGFADREKGVAANQQTMYYTASVTKAFTATAIMMLHERKQLDLDHPINDYIKPMRVTSPLWNPNEATVRSVATHMAGLTTFGRNCYEDQRGCKISAEETIGRYGILFWRPGDHFDYSNLGYGILGEAVSRVSGKSYADFLRDEVFLPLGMSHASLGISPDLKEHAAVRYSSTHGRGPLAYSATPGASGVYCNARGLALFGMFHLRAHLPSQKAILSDKSIGIMQNSTVAAGRGRYGLGWSVNEDMNGYRGVLAQGGTDDAVAFLQLIPSEGIAVAVLTNTGDLFPPKLVDEILSVLLPSYRQKKAIAADKKQQQPSPNTKASSSFVGNWAGNVQTYRAPMPLVFSISDSGNVQAQLGSDSVTLVNNARFAGLGLTGRFTGKLNVDEDTGSEPYDLDFELYLKGDMLYGSVTTRPRPNSRYGARWSYWVELRKESAR